MKFRFTIFILLLTFQGAFAQIFWVETFNNGSTGGALASSYTTGTNGAWTVSFPTTNDADANVFYVSCTENGMAAGSCGSACIGGGDATLHVGNVSTSPAAILFCPTGDCGASYDAGLGANNVTTDTRAESPIINCTGKTNITLSMNYLMEGDPGNDYAAIEYSINAGPWTLLQNFTPTANAGCAPQGLWTKVNILLPGATFNNQANVKFGIRWINNDDGIGTDPSFALDSMYLTTPPSANTKPTAVNDNASTGVGIAKNIDVQANDNANDAGQILVTSINTNPSHGTVILLSTDSIAYSPNAGYCGQDTFSYIITDNGVPPLADTAFVYITVGTPPPAPVVNAVPNPICPGVTLMLAGSSIAPGATYGWTGPNSYSDPGQDTSYVSPYTNAFAGVFTFTVTLAGCSSSSTITVTTASPPASPAAGANPNPICLGASLNLTAAGLGGATFSWTGPNGFSSLSQNPVRPGITAADSGMYYVTQTVAGCTSPPDSVLVDVNPCVGMPIAAFTQSNDTICSGSFVSFADNSTNTPTGWQWNFDAGGVAPLVTPNPATSTSQNPNVQFVSTSSAPVTMTIQLTASNGNGTGSPVTHTVVVMPPLPVANFSASPGLSVCKGSQITFTDLSTNSPSTWSWNFGVGATPATNNSGNPPAVVFSQAGQSTVTLIATNYCGSSTPFTQNVTVNDVPNASFNFTGASVCNNGNITFSDNSLGSPAITAWSWNFGTGTPGSAATQGPHTVNFPTVGTTWVTLTVTNQCGPSKADSINVTIVPCNPPVAGFSASSTTVCMSAPNNTVTFTDNSQFGPNNITWSFPGGNPGTSNLPNPTVTYNTPGIYSVTQIAQNAFGIDSVVQINYITVLSCLPPVAKLHVNDTSLCEGDCQLFTNLSTEAPFTSVQWIFPGGIPHISSLFDSVTSCFDTAGTYTVMMVVTNNYGSSIASQIITVTNAPRIYSHDTTIIAGNSVTLNCEEVDTITWSPANSLSNPVGFHPVATPVVTTTYKIVSNNLTCPSPDSVTVYVLYDTLNIKVPNAFTPDGNGKNDVFRVSSNIPLTDFKINIYNRWGERVYTSENSTSGWDGTYNGKLQNTGVFVYTISYRDLQQNYYKTINGNFTLIR